MNDYFRHRSLLLITGRTDNSNDPDRTCKKIQKIRLKKLKAKKKTEKWVTD